MVARFTTIGHSTRSLEQVLAMLREAQAGMLVDVRAFPRSRTNPAFNVETFPAHLAVAGIAYRHCAALGGRRKQQPDVDPALNAGWRVSSFHNYADYALGADFASALAQLVELSRGNRIALMCAEAVWWRCHRRIITDYLLLNGHAVDHLMSPGHIEHAKPTPGAQRLGNGKVVYPALGAGGLLAGRA